MVDRTPSMGRRGFLGATAAGIAAPVLVPSVLGHPASAATGGPGTWQHAVGAPRGSDIAVTSGRATEGRFGLLFKDLPAHQPPDALLASLARSMTDPRTPGTDPSDRDADDNPAITGGYTFLGQFIDHDLTRDTTPLTEQAVDPHGLRNFDTACFDLGSVYGRGPDLDPQLYDPARPGWLAVGEPDGVPDLPRAPDGTAHLGDPRNDENLVITQLHAAFLRFHNVQMAEGRSYLDARRLTQWHFQWLVVQEFLPRVCQPAVVQGLLALGNRIPWFRPRSTVRPMMPLEFSVAAYRFGHSMVRSEYEVNDAHVFPVFGTAPDDLSGGRPVPPGHRVHWEYFFDVPGRARPDGLNLARRIDTRLALPLHDLPGTVVSRDTTPLITDLAERNLLRGKRLGLPAGQDVAARLGQRPLTNAQLGLTDPGWGGRAPLWFYVLKEAELTQGGARLGPTGGLLVAGTLLTLLFLDRTSYVNARPAWRPATTPFTVGHLLQRAGVA
ncbi:peroxidase family protein [Klenkia brasiliensis]|uniref:Animal haem peroxidase n=1 Tax=Klenkia brasiliensis TaxID=333142 RepID=A0A1G7T7U8_9ACTN|nr:heme peroxidase family protein [Klenkia brasiliensis]SDG31437.1 Animal haem peroxidase [Klenkia brasiliensis]